MSEQRIKIPKASDKALIACFKDLANITGVNDISLNALGFNNIGAVNLNNELPASVELILKKNSAMIETISLNWSGLIIAFYRGGSYQPQDKSGIFDEIVLRQNNQQGRPDSEAVIEVVATITKKLKAFDPKRVVTSTLSEEQSYFEAIHNSNIERLEHLNEELVKSTHDYRLKLDDEHREKLDSLQAEFDSKKKLLDEELEKKKHVLHEQEEKLEEKRKALDDKSNTHARREIRRDILKEIKQRQTEFKLTKDTNKLRTPINVAMILLIGFFVISAGSAGFEFFVSFGNNSAFEQLLFLGVKQFIYSLGAVASMIFYIKWLNRWFEQHSNAEFQFKQFELDMERASWLVETSLEWNDKKDHPMPDQLLKSLSSNLFDREKTDHSPLVHPADQLASALLGSATTVKLKAGDSMIEIDPKKLAKSKVENKD